MRLRIRPAGFLSLLLALAAASCGIPSGAVPPLTLAPTGGAPATAPLPTPVPEPETLIVCTAEEPASLFLYSARGASTEAVFAALYDGPVDAASFSLQPVLLSKLPSQADGDVVLEPVAVRTGEVFFDPLTLAPRNLTYNDSYLPSGCTRRDCLRVFQGGEVTMDRMRVEFKLQPARFWSDGQPLTAGNSLFAYEVDSRPETPSSKFLVDRTAAYEALDDLTLRWTGIPGYLDGGAPGNVWTPLPRHVLASVPAADLATSDLAARTPLGWGAYAIEKWTPGRELVLARNEYYVSATGAAPAFDRLVYRFLEPGLRQGMQQLLTGECDVLDESLALSTGSGEDYNESLLAMLDLQEQGLLQVVSTPGVLVEQLTFNVRPGQRDNPLAQPAVRTAVAMCLDRQALAQATWRGLAGLAKSYLPPAHPLVAPAPAELVMDRQAARQLLQQAGWVTSGEDPSAPRIAAGAAGAQAGATLEFTLSVASSGLEEAGGEGDPAAALRVRHSSRPGSRAGRIARCAFPGGPGVRRRLRIGAVGVADVVAAAVRALPHLRAPLAGGPERRERLRIQLGGLRPRLLDAALLGRVGYGGHSGCRRHAGAVGRRPSGTAALCTAPAAAGRSGCLRADVGPGHPQPVVDHRGCDPRRCLRRLVR